MSVVLFRVDERLIHGQVVVGWGSRLHPDTIVVVDEELASSPWEQELYAMGVPPGVDTSFLTVHDARGRLPDWTEEGQRVMVLTRDIATMRRLAEGGLMRGEEVNVGGIHHAAGRHAVLPYVYLSDAEMQDLSELAETGVDISARDVPTTRKVGLPELLGRASSS